MKKILIATSNKYFDTKSILKYFSLKNNIKIEFIYNFYDEKLYKYFQKNKIKGYFLQNNELPKFFQENKYDLVVLNNFSKIIDDITLKTNNFISLHPSLLPKYKSKNPIIESYHNQDTKNGITFYKTCENICQGEIIFQKEIKTEINWSFKKLEKEIRKLENYYLGPIIEKCSGLNVLLIGSSAKEHALALKISKSEYLANLYLLAPNDGFCKIGQEIFVENFKELKEFALKNNINLIIVGDDDYLKFGIVDIFKNTNIKIIGFEKKFADIFSNKINSKKFLEKYNIRTFPYRKIDKIKDIKKYLYYFKRPIIKPSGLVSDGEKQIEGDYSFLEEELKKYLEGKYDDSSKTSIIEEKIIGKEVSLVGLYNGEEFFFLPLCKVFKRKEDNEVSQGIAGFCPYDKISSLDNIRIGEYKEKLKYAFKKEKINHPLILTTNLILAPDDIYVEQFDINLEQNEALVLLNYIQEDWLEIFFNLTTKMNNPIKQISFAPKACYSLDFIYKKEDENERNIVIKNLNFAKNSIKLYYNNIIIINGGIILKEGKTLSIVSFDKNNIYKFLEILKDKYNKINFDL